VVLPAPFGPISAWIAPRRIVRSTPCTAVKPRNSLVRLRVFEDYIVQAQKTVSTGEYLVTYRYPLIRGCNPAQRSLFARTFYCGPDG